MKLFNMLRHAAKPIHQGKGSLLAAPCALWKRILALVALGCVTTSQATWAQLNVFACEPEWAALVTEVAGSHAKTYTATTAYEDPHYVRARPSHLAAMRRADLVICSGADLEAGWLPLLVKKGSASVQPGKLGFLLAADVVKTLEVPTSVDRSLGDVHPQGNPHVHLNPANLIVVSRVLANRLAKIDPTNEQSYTSNQERFEKNFGASMWQLKDKAKSLQGKSVVAHHRSFSYLLDWLGMSTAATLEPKPGVTPSASDVAKAAEVVKQPKVIAVVRAPFEPSKPARWAASKGAKPLVELPFSVNNPEQHGALADLFVSSVDALLQAKP